MKHTYFSILFMSLFFMACNGKTDKASTAVPVPVPAPKAAAQVLPSIELTTLERLYKQASAVDYIFHNHPFSMSQDDPASIKSSLAYFSSETIGSIPANCKAVARQMYQINGEFVAEFDIYYSDKCKFFVQMINEKPAFANKMTPAGDEFFRKVISQAMNQGKQMHSN